MENNMNVRTNERVDNLAALITVSAEQIKARQTAAEAIESHPDRAAELISAIFGSPVPSVESYLASRSDEMVAA